jgi:hypothetical protein
LGDLPRTCAREDQVFSGFYLPKFRQGAPTSSARPNVADAALRKRDSSDKELERDSRRRAVEGAKRTQIPAPERSLKQSLSIRPCGYLIRLDPEAAAPPFKEGLIQRFDILRLYR